MATQLMQYPTSYTLEARIPLMATAPPTSVDV